MSKLPIALSLFICHALFDPWSTLFSVDDRVDELKGWLEREFMSKFIQQGVKPNLHPVVPPRHHQQPQDERLLRKLVEDRVRKYLREMRREKTPPAPEPVVQRKAEPLIVSQTYVRPMTPSPIHSIEVKNLFKEHDLTEYRLVPSADRVRSIHRRDGS